MRDVHRYALLEHDVAGEVEGDDGEVVHVDLGADSADAGAVEFDELSRAAEGAAGVSGALAEQAAIDELGDQAADGGFVETGLLGDPCSRARAEVVDMPEYDREIVAAQRHVIGGNTPNRHGGNLSVDFVC
ncbi:hypothetical protein GCM10009630_23930 [Kribbella jejuensis]